MKIKETLTLIDCQKVLNYHSNKKGDSWKIVPIDFLKLRLNEEYKEWVDCKEDLKREYCELIDIINIAVMLAERLRKEKVC